MIIGIDANEANLTSHRVGVNQYAFDLIHAFYNLKTNHQFVIYLKNPPLLDLPASRHGWDYRILPFPRLWTQTRLPFDLYTHHPRPDVFFSATHYAPRFSPVPTVISIMDLGFLKFPDQFTPRDFNQLKSWTAYSVKKASRIITISEFSRLDIVNTYGYPENKITVTYPGYDRNMFKLVRQTAVLKKYIISEPFILYLSSLKPNKNVVGLINAYSQLIKDEKIANNVKLVVAGKKAWLYDDIFRLVKKLRLSHRVVFTGFVEETEVPVLMTHSRAFVMPSFYEGFGIPVLEAMACGTPVVVSRVASLPEVAGNAGIYVDPSDPGSIAGGIAQALGSSRDKYIQAGLKRVKLFDWQHTARSTLQVLEQAAKT
ncbi:MAG: Glycosyl transferase group 1 [Candidatus Amesbacteria bacterium GW2011_GWA1_47_16]|uniref:Glycosyl transferase family 1 domain-containing protein n=2 Tax=Candidatus Amesiibacteriota TaxID=1752730 RepID=A0A1F4Z448_9BACT|nr:MAG: Glycosyl transferase group 1 [Candidatus Amesbacteria bacterium GW2011_GWA1_47_16]OGC99173.1 MAG: hypothetical protein A2701_02085 [Candidatus Amesbacteria bacterium RIFCSPHIGHO2_01_FULL_47_34]OGD00940.1 MAG: hypothetical protein A2972_03155 [Candidatus Amesbacteria bacterium RIFCSPLOWO2_01_FULL_47_33]